MTTLQLNIPDDLEALLRDVEGGAEAFILQTVRRELLERHEHETTEARLNGSQALDEKLLAEGYRAGHDEVREITEDYKYVDAEGWDDEY